MDVAEATNDDVCGRLRRVTSWKRPPSRSRYSTVTVTLLLLLMMFCCRIRVTATVAMAADDAVLWTPSSLSPAADRLRENVGQTQLASLPRRDDSSARDRHGAVVWRSLIAVQRLVGPASPDGGDRRAAVLARHVVVNNGKPPATTTSTTAAAWMSPRAAARVNVAAVITTPRGLGHRLPRIQIRSTDPPSRSTFSGVFHAIGTSFHQPGNSYLLASASYPLSSDRAAATSVKQLGNGIAFVQSNSTRRIPDGSGDKYTARTAATDDLNTFSDSDEKDADLEIGGGRDVRRRRRSGVQSVDKSDSGGLTIAINETSKDSSTARPRTSDAESAGMPLGAAALRYRSHGKFAALVDPVKSGRASVSSGSASANKWLQLETAGDHNSTSPSPLTEETTMSDEQTVSFATSSYIIATNSDSDSVEIKVLEIGINDTADAANSLSVANQTLNDSLLLNGTSKSVNSTLTPSGEWNCSKAVKSFDVQAALKLRMSDSAVAVCVYTLSFLFTLVAAWATTSVIFSLCVRNQRSSMVAGRQSASSQMVFGFVAIAAATRALYYVAAEYQQLAAVVTPGGRRAIYECWFPFLIAAFSIHQRLFCGKAVTQENDLILCDKRDHISRTGFRRDLCVFGLVLCSYLKLVFFLCLLIEFCVVPVKAVFVLRFVFALFAVLLSAANVHKIVTSSGRHVTTQVVLCALFVICAGFSAVEAVTLLSDDFALLFQQNTDVLIAVEAADRLAELFISALLCVDSSSSFSRNQPKHIQKSVDAGHAGVPGTMINNRNVVNYSQASTLSIKSSTTRQSWLNRLLDSTLKKSKVVDVGSVPQQTTISMVHAVGWTSMEDPAKMDGLSPLPPPSRMTRSRSMLYNDHGFIRFRVDGDTDGESDARTLDDDDGGQGQARSVPASEYASAEDLSSRRGLSCAGTPRWSQRGSPSLAGFRAPSIHLQDSIDRALDRCDIWRAGREQGQLSVDELRRIVQLYCDVNDSRRAHQRRTAGITSINYAEV